MQQKEPVKKKKAQTQQNNKKKQPKFNYLWIYAIAIVGLLFFIQNPGSNNVREEIGTTKLERFIINKYIESILFIQKDSRIDITLKEKTVNTNAEFEKFREKNIKGPHFYITVADFSVFNSDVKEIQERAVQDYLINNPDKDEKKVRNDYIFDIKQNTSKAWGFEIFWLVLMGILLFFIFTSFRGIRGGGQGGIFNFGKSRAQLFDSKNNNGSSFKDVAGMEGAKYEVEEIVDFLKNPKKYTELGGKIPKGALLVGPPGTGKTLLAKAVAGEAQVPFFSLSGSDFVEMFVGVGASRVRDLFQTAKGKAPCIIFIDEIDAIGRARGKNVMSGANDERESTLNQLLTEMDGFSTNAGVIILAATNRADVLDRALLRAGRFDRQIHVELPNAKERKGIFEVHVRNLKLNTDVDLEYFAKQTPGFSGADIANVCNESALIAARNGKKSVEKSDILAAIDRIVGGLERRGSMMSPEEKRVIAYHEAGHAAVGWLVEHAAPLVKVTIVPRGKSLGAAWYLPEERHITTTEQMFDEITAMLGGRAAEEVQFGKISTGALSDLEKVTKQAYAMVVFYGLNEKIGNISFYDSTGQQEYALTKPYSEKTAQNIDEEISKLIESAYKRAKGILTENKEKLIQLAENLVEKEVIFAEDLETIFGKRQQQTETLA
ncbi:MAG: ATP-dependent zinc metalloprotease FtsH [Bacteroidales bacterium]|jgi:cell division protease FtsH|nr:ATP-dependent zinc metalloprotease FtsH [Bacteroidales bacterium]